jgi:hypothetical protein
LKALNDLALIRLGTDALESGADDSASGWDDSTAHLWEEGLHQIKAYLYI